MVWCDVVLVLLCGLSSVNSFTAPHIRFRLNSPSIRHLPWLRKSVRTKFFSSIAEPSVFEISPNTEGPHKEPVILPSALFPRLPCLSSTPKATRIQLAEFIVNSQSSVDVWIQKFSDTKRDIELHLSRFAEETAFDIGADVELDAKLVADGRLNEMSLKRLVSRWRMQEDGTMPSNEPQARPRLVVLGSGWGAHAISKVIDTNKFDVTFISPRSYFIFTPMLASSSVGTVEYRSICEPMRSRSWKFILCPVLVLTRTSSADLCIHSRAFYYAHAASWTHTRSPTERLGGPSSNPFIDFLEASCTSIDANRKVLECQSAKGDHAKFQVKYDFLVVGVGMESNTFNTPGVREHCFFLKEVEDAKRLRAGIVGAFESASLPGLSEAERRRRLTFIVVGGGPTGVEFSGELFDFLQQDLQRFYPRLVPFVSTMMLQSGEGILEQFDGALQALALRSLRKEGTQVVLGARVVDVKQDVLTYRTKADGEVQQGYGLCVWACGNQARPLAKDLIARLQAPADAPRGRIVTDGWLRVLGTPDGSVLAMGDCAEAETGALPQTGQVAAQQGAYVARLLNDEAVWPPPATPAAAAAAAAAAKPMPGWLQAAADAAAAAGDPVCKGMAAGGLRVAGPFQFVSLGILAYLGGNSALAQVDVSAAAGVGDRPLTLMTGGWAGWLLWRSVYLTKQVALRNRVLVLFDWAKSKVFGRDIACL